MNASNINEYLMTRQYVTKVLMVADVSGIHPYTILLKNPANFNEGQIRKLLWRFLFYLEKRKKKDYSLIELMKNLYLVFFAAGNTNLPVWKSISLYHQTSSHPVFF